MCVCASCPGACPACQYRKKTKKQPPESWSAVCTTCMGAGKLDLGRVYVPWLVVRDNGTFDDILLQKLQADAQMMLKYGCMHVMDLGDDPGPYALSTFTVAPNAIQPSFAPESKQSHEKKKRLVQRDKKIQKLRAQLSHEEAVHAGESDERTVATDDEW